MLKRNRSSNFYYKQSQVYHIPEKDLAKLKTLEELNNREDDPFGIFSPKDEGILVHCDLPYNKR